MEKSLAGLEKAASEEVLYDEKRAEL